jgi:type I restriction enzyme M protein
MKPAISMFAEELDLLLATLRKYKGKSQKEKEIKKEMPQEFETTFGELEKGVKEFQREKIKTDAEIDRYVKLLSKNLPETNAQQHKLSKKFHSGAEQIRDLLKLVEHCAKLGVRAIGQLRKMAEEIEGLFDVADRKELTRLIRAFSASQANGDDQTLLTETIEPLRQVLYFYRQIHWLQEKFPDAKLRDVEGLVKLVSRKEIEKNDWSLTPGRYVGVAPLEEDEDFDFEERLREIHDELATLNGEAAELAEKIQNNFGELGI